MNAPTAALVAPRPERLRLVGQRRQILSMMHQRLMLGMLVYAGVVALIALRIVYLAAFGDHAGRQQGVSALVPDRGDIVDRDGQPLARTIDAWSIGLHPGKVIGDKLQLARKLAQLMPERSEADYFNMLRSGKNFFYLRRRAAPEVVEAVNALGEPGISLDREPERLYPQTSLAAHVIGFTNIDGHGASGAELAFDKQLSDAATRGTPVQLSISMTVQQALEHELQEAMTRFSAIGAAGVVMDVHTGEILAMTSLPSMNPNAPGKVTPDQMFNRATLGVYELGSSFKPFTLAMGYATLFDGGIYHPPTIQKVGPNNPLKPGKRVFTADTSYRMRSLLRLVVMKGTGKKADAPGYRVGGKTGTAQKIINGRYSNSVNITSFAGVFPMDDPRYVIVVMLDAPKATAETYGFTTAGWNVAPVVSKTVSRIAPMLGVTPDMHREPDMSEVLPYIHEE
jgi:cell division protein FtsI/penicillin-binding protein 2